MSSAVTATQAALSFVIDGKPQGKQRPRLGRGGRVYTPAATRFFERWVASCCVMAKIEGHIAGCPNGRAEVRVDCYFPDARRRDVDNVLKAVMDGLNGVAYQDDSQVTKATVTKAIDREHPRTEVTVRYE